MGWTWHSLADLPQVYDVIWCRFPHRPRLGIPADPKHPVVVRGREPYEPLGEALVHVTYGTSTVKPWREQLDLILEKKSEMDAAGLSEKTRFDLEDRVNLLPLEWCQEYFPDPRPCGRLNADCIRRLENRLRWAAEEAALKKK
jgi:hypothetical protein